MAYKNLRQFIERLEKEGEIDRISCEVNPILEITEIYDRVVKRKGRALLFEKVKGSPYPLVINLFGSERRMSLALGESDLENIARRIQEFLVLKPPEGLIETLKVLPKLHLLKKMTPRIVRYGPCQEVVHEDGNLLGDLPILQCWPKDAGRYITFPLVITKDPETGIRNIGTYRMQVLDGRATAMHWQVHKDGTSHFRKVKEMGLKQIEVAVALGADPVTMFSATCPLPYGVDELMFAGFLRQAPVELVRCRTVDLEVPAESEFVLEGTVDVEERVCEGPFGDHTGYYSLAKDFPVFRIRCMTRCKDPVYPTTVVGRPPMEDAYIAKAIERLFVPLIRTQLPEIVDINLPVEGVFTNCVLVSIKKSYPQHAKKIASSIWGFGQLMFEKIVMVFDHDVNLHDPNEVAWRALNNVDPKRDFLFTEGPVDELDVSASKDLFGSKVAMDCTRKWPEEGMERPWPDDIVMTEEIKEKVRRRWHEYGLDGQYLS